jgi:hypothetical protein
MNESAQPAGGAKLGADAQWSSVQGGIRTQGSGVTLQERGGSSEGKSAAELGNRNATGIAELTCTDVRTQLNDLIDGSLDSQTRERLERHLLQCSDCRALHRTLDQTTRGLRDQPRVRMPDGVRERLTQRLKQAAD